MLCVREGDKGEDVAPDVTAPMFEARRISSSVTVEGAILPSLGLHLAPWGVKYAPMWRFRPPRALKIAVKETNQMQPH